MTQYRPLVSICIPAFNVESTVEATLDSVFSQTYTPVEIIISDNYSTDLTKKILEKYRDRIRITTCSVPRDERSLKERSFSAIENMNHVVKIATGEFIALYHADDVYEKTIVEEEVNFLQQNPACGAVFTMCRFINQDGRPLPIKQRREWKTMGKNLFDFNDLFDALVVYGLQLNTPGVMFRKDVFHSVGPFRRTYEQATDYDMWLRMAEVKQIGVIDKELFLRRVSHLQGSALGGVIYRFKELPMQTLFRHYIEDRGTANCISQKARMMIQWGKVCDCIRRALKFYESGNSVEGNQYLATANDLVLKLPVVTDKTIKKWQLVRKTLMMANMIKLQRHAAKWINRYIHKRQRLGRIGFTFERE